MRRCEGHRASATWVRLLGIRRQRYVEFELALDDPDLSVELVLPVEGFVELCAERGARHLEPRPGVRDAFELVCRERGVADDSLNVWEASRGSQEMR